MRVTQKHLDDLTSSIENEKWSGWEKNFIKSLRQGNNVVPKLDFLSTREKTKVLELHKKLNS